MSSFQLAILQMNVCLFCAQFQELLLKSQFFWQLKNVLAPMLPEDFFSCFLSELNCSWSSVYHTPSFKAQVYTRGKPEAKKGKLSGGLIESEFWSFQSAFYHLLFQSPEDVEEKGVFSTLSFYPEPEP